MGWQNGQSGFWCLRLISPYLNTNIFLCNLNTIFMQRLAQEYKLIILEPQVENMEIFFHSIMVSGAAYLKNLNVRNYTILCFFFDIEMVKSGFLKED